MVVIKTVNGVAPVKEPDIFNVSTFDLYSDSTGRTSETGKMIPYLIRANIYKIELEYTGSASEIRAIRNLFQISAKNTSLSVEFLDLDEYITKEMYPGDRVQSTTRISQNDGRYSISFSLTEF